MKFEYFVARRTLFRSQAGQFVSFIRGLAILGLAIGTIALTITAGILRGFEKNMIEKITGFDAHIRISSLNGNRLHPDKAIFDTLQAFTKVLHVAPYVSQEAMLRFGDETEGLLIEGMNYSDFLSIQAASKRLISGTMDYDSGGIYLGKGAAEILNVQPGDSVEILILNGNPSIFNPIRSFKTMICGIFTTGMSEYDQNLAYCSLSLAQQIFALKQDINGYQLVLDDPDASDAIAALIYEKLHYPYYTVTWKESHYTLFRWLETQKLPILIVFGLIALVALVNIISTLVMIVLAKEQEIAVLNALGLSRKRIQRLFVTDGLLIAVSGLSIGIIIAKALEWLQMTYGLVRISADVYFIDRVPISISWNIVLIVTCVGIFMAIIASVYPSRKASAVRPVELLRYE